LADGYSADEAAQIRGITSAQLLADLNESAASGLSTEAHWLLSPAKLELLQQFVADRGTRMTVSSVSQLPPGVTGPELMYFLKSSRRDAPNATG
jgi:hypothetical protein